MTADDLLAKLHARTGKRRMMQAPKEPDQAASRRGRNNRARGNAASLEAARLFGGRKVEELQLPWDVEGELWASQVKSFQAATPRKYKRPSSVTLALPGPTPWQRQAWVLAPFTPYPTGHLIVAPQRWADLFETMRATHRTPRILERYASPGHRAEWWVIIEVPPIEYYGLDLHYEVWPAETWLAAHGTDDAAPL